MNYVEDLKKALQALKIDSAEINDILADHEEMIREAKAQGLSDEEILSKLGDPAKVAQDIADLCEHKRPEKVSNPNDHSAGVFKPGNDLINLTIQLVSEDIQVEADGGTTIRVTYEGNIPLDYYEIGLNGNHFVLKRLNKHFGFTLRSSNMEFHVLVPQSMKVGTTAISGVSGDYNLDGLRTETLNCNSTSGDGLLKDIKAKNVKISSVSGDVSLNQIVSHDMLLSEVSGDANINQCKVEQTFDINTVSGDLKVTDSSCATANFRTVSGDLQGTEFYPEVVEMKSVSGDIFIRNHDASKSVNVRSARSVSGTVRIEVK